MAVARIRGQVEEGRPFNVRAFVPLLDGTRIMQADVTDWELRIYDLSSSTPGTALFELTGQTTSAVIQSSLQTWEHDDVGYNFKDTVYPSRQDDNTVLWTNEGLHVYRLEYTFNMVSATEDPSGVTAIVECVSAEST